MAEFVVSDTLVTNYCQEEFTKVQSQESWPGTRVVLEQKREEEMLRAPLSLIEFL